MVFRKNDSWNAVFPFFTILFPGVWGTYLWTAPSGPEIGGIYWVPVLFATLILTVVLAIALPQRLTRVISGEDEEKKEGGVKMIKNFYWILVSALVAIIVIGYLR